MRIYIHDILKGTNLLKAGALWGQETGTAFFKLICPLIQNCDANLALLNFDSILMLEMNFVIEAFTLLGLERFPGKTILLENVPAESLLNIKAAFDICKTNRHSKLILPICHNKQILFIGHLQPHLQEFWKQIQGEEYLQAPALAQRLGKTTGRVNDNLRVFYHLGVLNMKVEKGIKTYFHLDLSDSAESLESEETIDSAKSGERDESSTDEMHSSDSIDSEECTDSVESNPDLAAQQAYVTLESPESLEPKESNPSVGQGKSFIMVKKHGRILSIPRESLK